MNNLPYGLFFAKIRIVLFIILKQSSDSSKSDKNIPFDSLVIWQKPLIV